MEYLYSVVRFVPNPTLGEFVNVGIIAGNDDLRDWSVQWLRDMRRAKGLDDVLGAKMFPVLQHYRGRIEEYVNSVRSPRLNLTTDHSEPQINHDWLTQMHLSTNDVIQFTKPLPVFAETSQAAIEVVHDLLLFEREPSTLPQGRDRLFDQLEESIQRTVDITGLAFRRRATLSSGEITNPAASRSSFTTYIHDKVHVTFVWSFNMPQERHDRELTTVTSSLWFVDHCRGKPLVVSDRNEKCLYDGKKAPRFAALVEPPQGDLPRELYRQAELGIKASEIEQYEPRSLDQLCSSVGADLQ